jgi:hypothetical protein
MDLRIGEAELRILPTSDGSTIGLPPCSSASSTPPTFFYDSPFTLPVIGGD